MRPFDCFWIAEESSPTKAEALGALEEADYS
jgi:hypothetical protein